MSEDKSSSKETVKQSASDLKPVETASEQRSYSVPIEGKVYAVKAESSAEAADKANKLHKKEKKS